MIVDEIDEYGAALKGLEKISKEQMRATEILAAFKRYVNGGSMKALLKVLEG